MLPKATFQELLLEVSLTHLAHTGMKGDPVSAYKVLSASIHLDIHVRQTVLAQLYNCAHRLTKLVKRW